MTGLAASITYLQAYIANAMRNLRGLGFQAWAPFAFQTDARIWKADGRIVLPTTEIISGNGSIFNNGRILNASIANRLRISRGFPALPQIGAVLEGARTELLTNGKTEFNVATTVWTNGATAPTYTADTDVAPDNTTTADTLDDTSGSGSALIFEDLTVAADTVIRSFSYFTKKTSGATHFPGIALDYFTPTLRTTTVVLNTNTGVATRTQDTGGASTFDMEDAGDYWRCWIAKANSDSNTSMRVGIYPALSSDGTSESVAATGATVFWGAQAEVGPKPSSYIIPAAGTRADDDLRYSNAGEVLLTSPEGSVICIVTVDFENGDLGTNAMIFDGVVSGSAEGVRLRVNGGGTFNLLVRHLGSSVADITSTTVVQRGRTYVVAATWKDGEYRLYVDGVLEISDLTGASATSTNATLYIGQSMSNNQWLFGTLAHLLTFDRVLTLRQIQDVTKTIIQPIYPGRLRLAA